jgi:hypothetical protein
MARLFSNSEYIGVVLANSEACTSTPRAQRISVRLLLVAVHEGYSIPIDTIEILREWVENAVTTIRNNRGMLERVEELFRRGLIIVFTITVTTLNISCND